MSELETYALAAKPGLENRWSFWKAVSVWALIPALVGLCAGLRTQALLGWWSAAVGYGVLAACQLVALAWAFAAMNAAERAATKRNS